MFIAVPAHERDFQIFKLVVGHLQQYHDHWLAPAKDGVVFDQCDDIPKDNFGDQARKHRTSPPLQHKRNNCALTGSVQRGARNGANARWKNVSRLHLAARVWRCGQDR